MTKSIAGKKNPIIPEEGKRYTPGQENTTKGKEKRKTGVVQERKNTAPVGVRKGHKLPGKRNPYGRDKEKKRSCAGKEKGRPPLFTTPYLSLTLSLPHCITRDTDREMRKAASFTRVREA